MANLHSHPLRPRACEPIYRGRLKMFFATGS